MFVAHQIELWPASLNSASLCARILVLSFCSDISWWIYNELKLHLLLTMKSMLKILLIVRLLHHSSFKEKSKKRNSEWTRVGSNPPIQPQQKKINARGPAQKSSSFVAIFLPIRFIPSEFNPDSPARDRWNDTKGLRMIQILLSIATKVILHCLWPCHRHPITQVS